MKTLSVLFLALSFFSTGVYAEEESSRIDSVSVSQCKVSEEKTYCFMKIERIFDDPSTHSIAVCDKTDDETYPCPKVTECEDSSLNIVSIRTQLSEYKGTDNPPKCAQFKFRARSGGGR